MAVFGAQDFDGHEQLVFAADPESNLCAIIAIHDTSRGPALGGCRMWRYGSEAEAIRDALRLSRGMTYKAALAGLPLGGGKSVIIGDAGTEKTPALLRAMGRAVANLQGRYIIAEDVGTSVADMAEIRSQTVHVTGLAPELGGFGDPSPETAYGVFVGIHAAAAHRLERKDLEGLRVAVQGLGQVGLQLCRYLAGAGAELVVSDLREDCVRQAVEAFGAVPAAADAIYDAEVDIFAPCALGAVINDATVPRLKAAIVAGAANNQLAEDRHGAALRQRGILYAPDYVINAGGLICVAAEHLRHSRSGIAEQVETIHDTLMEIFHIADALNLPANRAADRLAEERIPSRKNGRLAA